MSNKVLVFIDQFKGSALPASWEALGAALELGKKLGGGVAVLVVGEGAKAVAAEAFQFGVEQVLYADDATLGDYRPEPYATLVSKIAKDQAVEVVLLPTTTRGREIASMTAVDLVTGVMPDVIGLDVVDGKLVATRPVYAGKLIAKTVCDAMPQIVTTRGRAFPKPPADASKTGTPVQVGAAMPAGDIKTKVVEVVPSGGGVSLSDAAVIVSGGRGVSNNPSLTPPGGMSEADAEIWRAQQGFKLIGELASVMNGAVGASRAAVDAGYIPYAHQVGQTGKLVAPDLYIACGISGAIQHLAGMRNSKMVVAINKDPDAPIFRLSRFGVIGDLYTIVPALSEAFRKKLGK